jgi:copper chaperone
MTQTRFIAPDISCGGCAASIKNALGRLEGILIVNVDVPAKSVMVEHDESIVPREKVAEALDKAGFPVS